MKFHNIGFLLAVCVLAASPALAQGGTVRNGLPPTSMDSFVTQAAGQAELIYGDEGYAGPPPYEYFEYGNRINSGIFGTRDAGLTTGHGSMMPSAWGRDEFLGAEWSMSGSNGGNPQLNGPGAQADEAGNPATATANNAGGQESPNPTVDPYQENNGAAAGGDPNNGVAAY